MSYSQDHQSDSVWQKYPATILQVIKGMMGAGCMHLLEPFFFSHFRETVMGLNWRFIFSPHSTGGCQKWTLISYFLDSHLTEHLHPNSFLLHLYFLTLKTAQLVERATWNRSMGHFSLGAGKTNDTPWNFTRYMCFYYSPTGRLGGHPDI